MKVAVLMSGGIDSSIASYLLLKEGFDVSGVFIKMYSQSLCCSDEALYRAKDFSNRFNFPFYVLDASEDFQKYVIQDFISSYEKSFTPNPCIVCNKYIKFGLFLDYALNKLNAKFVASGHYARIRKENNRNLLLKGTDPLKDQSYMLYTLAQDVLSRLIFPLGEYKKDEVKRIAVDLAIDFDFGNESEDLCFVNKDYKSFLKKYISPKKGKIVSVTGEVLGEHDGIHLFTIGQREGLRISSSHPLYVIELDPKNNIVKVGPKSEAYKKDLIVYNINLIPFDSLEEEIKVTAKVRYRGEEKPCIVKRDGNYIYVTFLEPQFAITPGQSIVFYKKDIVIGGGIIKRVL